MKGFVILLFFSQISLGFSQNVEIQYEVMTPCPGQCNGAIVAYVTGGTPPYVIGLGHDALGGPNQLCNTYYNGNALFPGLCGEEEYYIYVTDDNGNGTTEISDAIYLNDPTIATYATSSYNGFDVSCFGACDASAIIQVDVNPAFITSYNWSNGMTGITASGLCAQTYLTDVEYYTLESDGFGNAVPVNCVITDQVTINEPLEIIADVQITHESFGNDGTLEVTNTTGGTGTYSYSWSNQNGAIGAGASISNLAAGTYTLTVTDSNGCTYTEDFIVISTVGTPEGSLNTTNVFPVPFSESLQVNSNVQIEKLELYDLQGNLLMLVTPKGLSVEINTTQLKPGFYWIKVFYGDGVQQFNLNKY